MFTNRISSWKQITAGFAAFGFLLSFIAGLIGPVVFGIVILRALIFSFLFGGISMLIMFLVDAFIPELLNPSADEDSDVSDEDENIIEDETDDEGGRKISGGNLDITIDDEDKAAEPVTELEELDSAGSESEVSETDEDAAELVEELEEAEEISVKETAEAKKTEKKEVRSKKASEDDLPDIETYSDSFDAVDTNVSNEGLSSIDGMGSTGGAEIMGDMHNTQDIVKAVQTVLKKDQEG